MEPFKNLLGYKAAQRIAQAIQRSHKNFDSTQFLKGLEQELEPLELKERMLAIKNRLIRTLPKNPEQSFPILAKALKQNDSDSTGLNGFLVWPLTQMVAEVGLKHFDLSMKTLESMTQVFTAEFAIRSFFIAEEALTLKQFEKWLHHESEHVRRLVSEGSRPLLPWGQKLPSFVQDPEKTWKLLETLKNDSSLYVRKSVANHLNDHSKNHQDLIAKKLLHWQKQKDFNKEVDWIIKHAARTLIKKGHPMALKLIGVSAERILIQNVKLVTRKLKLNQKLVGSLTLSNPNKKLVKVILDHEILFLKANGEHKPKVFKGTSIQLKAGEKQQIHFHLPIRKTTTRTYYFGEQFWTPFVNGKKGPKLKFQLLKS